MPPRRSSRSAAPAPLTADTRLLVLHGKEEMLKQTRLDELKKVLSEAHGEVETFRFDGSRVELADVLDEVRGYSLMQTYKLVLVDDAEPFVKRYREQLERYAESPVDHATLVLRADTWHKGNLDKKIKKHGDVIKCNQPKPAEASAWLMERSKEVHSRTLEKAAAHRLVERLGPHLQSLDSELAKLAVLADDRGHITADIVDEVVGRTSDEQAYQVQEAVLRALTTGRPADALAEARELIELAGQPPVLVMYFVGDLMRKLAVARQMRNAGHPPPAIAKALKLWGGRDRALFAALERLGPREPAALFREALQQDARGKSGLGDPVRNLERFLVAIADNSRRH